MRPGVSAGDTWIAGGDCTGSDHLKVSSLTCLVPGLGILEGQAELGLLTGMPPTT